MPRNVFGCTGEPKCSTRAAKDKCRACKDRHNADQKVRYWAKPEHWRAMNRKEALKRKYGLTVQEKLELFESSDGLCALCLEAPATDVDHDHETGKVRGALCGFCNRGLGFIEKMGATSDSIVEYLTTEWSAA